ncbi:MAG: hypothetical protein J3K34DRAFT_470342 [Monoraphidium minutum]|nr:MAG: hypothetical protein J3K34DRAFT_470342 [Monoraphidium minutum]
MSQRAQGSRGVAVKASPGGGGRHAVLHDFCMTLPYGALAAAGGLASLLLGAQAAGWQVAGAGAAVLLASALSLKAWRAGGSSLPYTLVSGAAAGWVAFSMWQRFSAGLSPLVSGAMLALSGAAAAFCLYNAAAGGNPPPSAKKEAAQ